MVDRLGVIGKTNIPSLGDPITSLDVTADTMHDFITCINNPTW